MARYFGKVGYATPTEVVDGVWSDSITERAYYGDILDSMVSTQVSDKVNDDIRLQQRISVVADAYILENFSRIKYIEWMGQLWTISSVTNERPRLILSLGGVYNGPVPS